MIFDNNYDKFGNKTDDNGSAVNQPLIGEYPDLSNETVNPVIISGGTSKNYQTGTAGWQITPAGDAEFNNITARGTLITGGATTSKIIADSADGTLKFYYGDTQYSSLLVDSSAHLEINSDYIYLQNQAANYQFAQFNSIGLNLPSSSSIFFSGGSSLVDGGAYLAIKGSGGAGQLDLKTSGTVYPETDDNKDLGANGKRYYTVWSHHLTTGDIVFSDRYCPICGIEFEEGDCLINFVHKKDTTNPDLPHIYTIPAHLSCANIYKKEDIAFTQETVKNNQATLALAHQEAESQFDKVQIVNQKLSIE